MAVSTHKIAESVSTHDARRGIVGFKERASSLGIAFIDTPTLIQHIGEGFSFESLRRLSTHSGIPLDQLASVMGIPERTLARRKAAGKLSSEESERLLRLSSVFEKAVELFNGDVEAAVHWLTHPKKALGYRPPLEYSRTELGAREVENLIGRIGHGVFS